MLLNLRLPFVSRDAPCMIDAGSPGSVASLAADLGYSEPPIGALIGHKGRTITSRYVHAADAVFQEKPVVSERAPIITGGDWMGPSDVRES